MPRVKVTAIEYDEIKGNYDRLFTSISDRAEELANAINRIDDEIDLLERQKTVEKEAFLEATELISNNLEDHIKAVVLDAMYQSYEFNYPAYIERMLSAISANYTQMVTISSNKNVNTFNVTVDLTKLGNIADYAKAVDSVRGSFSRPVTSDPAAASRMWKEKIFKTAREGGKVFRSKKDKKTGKEIKIDVTHLYIQKYNETINARLSELPTNQAPFWYLIEHGNISAPGFNKEGTPYPVVQRINMSEQIAQHLEKAHKKAYTSLLTSIEQAISDRLWGQFGFSGTAPGLKEIEKEVVKKFKEDFTKRGPIEIETGATLSVVKGVDRVFESFRTSAGNIAVRARGAHGYFTNLVGKK